MSGPVGQGAVAAAKGKAEAGPRRKKGAARLAEILAAGLEEFTARGFAAARMEDIAQRARVSKGSLYLYFPDKKALFQGVIMAALEPLVERNCRVLQNSALSLRERILEMYAPLLNAELHSPLRLSLCLAYGEGLHNPDLMSGVYEKVLAPSLERLRQELLRNAAGFNEPARTALERFPILLLAPLIFGVIHQTLFRSQAPLDLEALFKAHLDVLFHPAG